MRPRWIAPLLAALLWSALPAAVAAHVELTSSTPEADEELDEAPDEVVLTFDGELDPDGSGFKVTDASGREVGGGEVDLEVADRNELRGDVAIEEPGSYTVSWTVLGIDGDEITGEFSFGYRSAEAEAGPAANTALPRPAPIAPASLPGLVLLVGATATGLWRLARR